MASTPKTKKAAAAADSLDARVKAGVEHFEATMGHLPIQMKTLSERLPQVFAGYMDIRQWVMQEPPAGALPRKYKHLIFVLLDCIYGNDKGAVNHGRAALRRGLAIEELLEGMVQVFIVGGIGVYGQTGYKVLDSLLESDEAKVALAGLTETQGSAKRSAGKAVAVAVAKAKTKTKAKGEAKEKSKEKANGKAKAKADAKARRG